MGKEQTDSSRVGGGLGSGGIGLNQKEKGLMDTNNGVVIVGSGDRGGGGY